MTALKAESLFTRIEKREQAAQRSWGVFVPVDAPEVYTLLSREIAEAVTTAADRQSLLLIVDAVTAQETETVQAAAQAAVKAYHFGDSIPQSWAVLPNAVPCALTGEVIPEDRFFVVLAPNISFALIGAHEPQGGFRGGWTGQRGVVERVAETILRSSDEESKPAFPTVDDTEHAKQVYACSIRLMTRMTQHYVSCQRDINRDKDELRSVLDIIKAISARRRAHDILYVFVEQIARIVEMARCSVVRVWGEERKGHVLASHEDRSVRDLIISLDKYPELVRAMESRATVIIDDVLHHPLTSPHAESLAKSGITSVIVIPVVLFDQNVGSFFLRAARGNGPFSMREIGFCEIVSNAAANALERSQLFESIQRANERLEFLAITDGLTGLYNHRFFHDRLEEEFERSRRYSLHLSCLILDVDDFKGVNDTYGHLQGDVILREIAQLTSRAVRKSDTVARYGGEEFVVIMPQTGLKGAKAQAERIRTGIANNAFEGMPEGEHITVSIGLAMLDADTMSNCEALVRAADEALYEAKRAGKNRVVVGENG